MNVISSGPLCQLVSDGDCLRWLMDGVEQPDWFGKGAGNRWLDMVTQVILEDIEGNYSMTRNSDGWVRI